MTKENCLPLDGLRIIDLSTEITGPYATKMLADAGADVIKIEPPEGDPLRRWSASHSEFSESESGAFFKYLNTSKRGAVADLEQPAGRKLLLDLAVSADLIIESCGAGRLASLDLGWEELQKRNPVLSLVSISPWGQTGPWANRPATE